MKKILAMAFMVVVLFVNISYAAERSDAEKETFEKGFYVKTIDDVIFARIKGKSFKDDCTIPREDLRYLHVLHKGFDGKTHEGELFATLTLFMI